MSHATVNLWLPRIVADLEDILPSEVRAKRKGMFVRQRSIPLEKQKRIVELHDNGVTQEDIAFELDINRSTVYRYLKKAGRVKATK